MIGNINTVDSVRLGFIGVGRIFRVGYEKWLADWMRARKGRVTLAGMADPNAALCRKYSRRFGAPWHEDALDMLRRGDVNAVVISSPNWAHEEQVLAAAAAGAHVLCEKPMAPAYAACRRMANACADARVFLQMSFMRRFSPAMQRLRSMALGGDLGGIIELNCNWPYYLVDIDEQPYAGVLEFIEKLTGRSLAREWGAWRLKDPRCGGGDFLDHGPHILDLFTWFNGRITHVSAESRVMSPGRNEDFTVCRIKFENGAFGSITTTLFDHAAGVTGRVHGFVRGTRGRVDFIMPETNNFAPIWLRHHAEPRTDAGKIMRALGISIPRDIHFKKTLLFRDQLDYFTDTILGRRPPHPAFGCEPFAATGDDGAYTIRIVEQAYAAAAAAPVWLPVEI